MNRVEKKCVIATVGVHLLLLTILVVGPAFYNPQPKANAQLLDLIPPGAIEGALNSGVRNATPPAPAPAPTVTPPLPQQTPPPPVVHQAPPPPTPPPPVTQPTTSWEDRVKKLFEPKPVTPTPTPAPTETKHKILINTQLVAHVSNQTYTPKTSRDDSQAKLRATALSAAKALQRNLSPGIVVGMPGESSTAAVNYRDALMTIYYNAWITPDGAANDVADTIAKITVASDGTVVNSRITTPSGDAKMDDSVQAALNRVSSVPPLPDQSKAEEDFSIEFDLKTKRTLE